MSEESSNYFVRLYRGDVPLVITFWIFYVIISTVLYFILPLIFVFITCIFFSLAAWNSASKYEGPSVWKILVKILVVLSILGLFLEMFGLGA